MKIKSFTILCLVTQLCLSACPEETVFPNSTFPELTITTSLGEVVIELDRNRAPKTVNHFLHHVASKTYDNNLVHRVVKDYVVQTGAFLSELTEINACGKVINESGNGLLNKRGTIAMARYDDPHSASSSYYFNVADNTNLNPNEKSWGYTVFGHVVSGMEVIDKMAQTKTSYNKELDAQDVPVNPILIISVRLN
ncbi:peptidylprolyl isomerase [Marinicella litoralis]|uniref:Peptidyl-prolyl cis-trans isomerase n=1 Tax=Marinicella litoralis TaxID=644220 RepID=A0A4R6XM99_9GAMM|nr:peptidylprolyl isomerase [Marinicella litoralis]TDR20782.1 peptidyl-prolyl cis-trans isomerase A (cyclophilin A) [Marinicella litoralis]